MSVQQGPPRLPESVTTAQRELVRVYRNAATRLNRQLTDARLSSFQRFRIGEQLRQIEAIVAALDASVANLSGQLISPSYRLGQRLSIDAMSAAGLDVSAYNFGNAIATEAVAVVADQLALDLMAANGTLDRQARQFLRNTQQILLEESQINEGIARGIVEGETRRQVSVRLADQLREKIKEGTKVVVNGRKYDPDYYAELVARTRTREAVTQGSIRAAMDYGIYLFQISVHSNPCEEICAALQGKVFSVVDGTGFPMMTRKPPYHPACRHCAIAYVPKNETEEAALRRLSASKDPLNTYDEYRKALAAA